MDLEWDDFYNTSTYSVYLGTPGFNWQYWGDPATGRVASIAIAGTGCKASAFGDAGYFQRHVQMQDNPATCATFALACRDWTWRRFFQGGRYA